MSIPVILAAACDGRSVVLCGPAAESWHSSFDVSVPFFIGLNWRDEIRNLASALIATGESRTPVRWVAFRDEDTGGVIEDFACVGTGNMRLSVVGSSQEIVVIFISDSPRARVRALLQAIVH